MDDIIELVSRPWHWSISGIGIVVVMGLLLREGGQFGVSSNLRTLCAIGGAGRVSEFFQFDWRAQLWNLIFAAGAIAGGYVAVTWLASPAPVDVADATQAHLSAMGIYTPATLIEGRGYVPAQIFDIDNMLRWQSLLMLVGGGFLVGFGTRYAGGCTSGHAISGLADLQWPSLLAVVGFFIGGLLTTWFLLPLILTGI